MVDDQTLMLWGSVAGGATYLAGLPRVLRRDDDFFYAQRGLMGIALLATFVGMCAAEFGGAAVARSLSSFGSLAGLFGALGRALWPTLACGIAAYLYMLLALLGREARTGGLLAPEHYEAVRGGVLGAVAYQAAALWWASAINVSPVLQILVSVAIVSVPVWLALYAVDAWLGVTVVSARIKDRLGLGE